MRPWFPRLRLERIGTAFAPWRHSPPLVLANSFLLLIMVGALLLKLPFATETGIGWYQAFFTSVSAVTVTGLVVVDTGASFTGFGEAVIAVLIQLGGIGLMTFAALTVLLLGGRIGLQGQRVVREAMSQTSPKDVLDLIKRVALVALVFELAGMALLALIWIPAMGWGEGLWYSLFHSVSAFNNAGFALEADSLQPWAGHPGVVLVISMLFIIGGLGFAVLVECARERRFHFLSLHAKLTLSGTLVLILVPFVLVLLFEWGNPGTLGMLETGERWLAAWFQAVTPRTAGFNTLDTAALTMPTTLMIMLLMFVGAGSNSTASGIKVSTLMVVLLSTRAFLRGRHQVTAFGRAIPREAVFRAHVVTILSMMLVMLSLFLFAVIESHLDFFDIAFEAFSAFGTVGLSRGITAELSQPSGVLLMMLMFAGRIGPLALAFALARPRPELIRYAEGEVQIG
jgi:trk system potassium uptake protein TrkH